MLVSFVIPTKDAAHYLPIAVNSALSQSHKEVELIIIDDGSKDFTWQYLDWLESRNDPRVKIERNILSRGRCAARNQGNALASGELILVLDADDAATPNRAEMTIRKHNQTNADLIYGSFTGIDCVGNRLYEYRADVFNRERAEKEMFNRICHSTVAYTKEFSKAFPYSGDKDISRLGIDDWEQQIRAAFSGAKFEFIPQLLAVYREHEKGISKTRDPKEVAALKSRILDGLKVPA